LNSEQFIKAIEKYYGNYKFGVKKVVWEYLAKIPEDELPEIRRQLHLTVSTQYGHVPDVATIEQARKDIRSSRPALSAYQPLLPDSTAKDFNPELGGLIGGLVKKLRKPERTS